jgi:hypothetical protein
VKVAAPDRAATNSKRPGSDCNRTPPDPQAAAPSNLIDLAAKLREQAPGELAIAVRVFERQAWKRWWSDSRGWSRWP